MRLSAHSTPPCRRTVRHCCFPTIFPPAIRLLRCRWTKRHGKKPPLPPPSVSRSPTKFRCRPPSISTRYAYRRSRCTKVNVTAGGRTCSASTAGRRSITTPMNCGRRHSIRTFCNTSGGALRRFRKIRSAR